MNDTDRLNGLEDNQTGYGRGWICRRSFRGRGIRLHETSSQFAFPTVREAIDDFLLNNKQL